MHKFLLTAKMSKQETASKPIRMLTELLPAFYQVDLEVPLSLWCICIEWYNNSYIYSNYNNINVRQT